MNIGKIYTPNLTSLPNLLFDMVLLVPTWIYCTNHLNLQTKVWIFNSSIHTISWIIALVCLFSQFFTIEHETCTCNILINIYTYSFERPHGWLYTIRITKLHNTCQHLNMPPITNSSSSHYAAIQDLYAMVYHKTNYRGGKYI